MRRLVTAIERRVATAGTVRARVRRLVRNAVRVVTLPVAIVSLALCMLLVGKIVGSVVWFLGSLPLARKFAVWRFGRRIRRHGLDPDAADELTEAYGHGLALFGPSKEETS